MKTYTQLETTVLTGYSKQSLYEMRHGTQRVTLVEGKHWRESEDGGILITQTGLDFLLRRKERIEKQAKLREKRAKLDLEIRQVK